MLSSGTISEVKDLSQVSLLPWPGAKAPSTPAGTSAPSCGRALRAEGELKARTVRPVLPYKAAWVWGASRLSGAGTAPRTAAQLPGPTGCVWIKLRHNLGVSFWAHINQENILLPHPTTTRGWLFTALGTYEDQSEALWLLCCCFTPAWTTVRFCKTCSCLGSHGLESAMPVIPAGSSLPWWWDEHGLAVGIAHLFWGLCSNFLPSVGEGESWQAQDLWCHRGTYFLQILVPIRPLAE